MEITKENIWDEAHKGNTEILYSPLADQVPQFDGTTPLHALAYKGIPLILIHPSIDVVKDKFGITPLHALAFGGGTSALSHPSVDKVRDSLGKVPLQYINPSIIPRNWFKERYPSINIKGKKITKRIVEKALNISNTEHFIWDAVKEELKSKISIP